jgi:endoglucanase
MGVEPPAGITIYGWASQAQTAHGWIFGPPWSPLPEVGTAENAMQRRIEPPRFSIPYFEYLVEHPALVMQQEYTVHQSIGPMAALALYLNAQ